jgi:hypothetical protein
MNQSLLPILALLLIAIIGFRFGLASKGYERRKAYRDMIDKALASLVRGESPNLKVILEESRKIRDDIGVWKRWGQFDPAVASLSNAENTQMDVQNPNILESIEVSIRATEKLTGILETLRHCAE